MACCRYVILTCHFLFFPVFNNMPVCSIYANIEVYAVFIIYSVRNVKSCIIFCELKCYCVTAYDVKILMCFMVTVMHLLKFLFYCMVGVYSV